MGTLLVPVLSACVKLMEQRSMLLLHCPILAPSALSKPLPQLIGSYCTSGVAHERHYSSGFKLL